MSIEHNYKSPPEMLEVWGRKMRATFIFIVESHQNKSHETIFYVRTAAKTTSNNSSGATTTKRLQRIISIYAGQYIICSPGIYLAIFDVIKLMLPLCWSSDCVRLMRVPSEILLLVCSR